MASCAARRLRNQPETEETTCDSRSPQATRTFRIQCLEYRLALTSQKEEADEAEFDEYLIEITTHIREDQAWALEMLGLIREQRLGANFDKATLIREALDLLIEKYYHPVAKWPDKWPDKRRGSAR